MGKRVTLMLMLGSFERGFEAILQISKGVTDETGIHQVTGKLPPAPPQLLEIFNNWQSVYNQMLTLHYRIKSEPGQVTNFSLYELSSQLRVLGSQLVECLNDWLNFGSREWQRIRDSLQQNLDRRDEVEVLIQTNNALLQQLPWHLWNLFSEYYTRAEVALSLPEYEPPPLKTVQTKKVRILAILGDSTHIDVEQDRTVLQQLLDAEVKFLLEPQRQELNNQLWQQQWDILFFAGHSRSQKDRTTGQIYINQNQSLSIDDLKFALSTAVENGLKLAIFNSCDGLGLARQLAQLHIPQVIVMREFVPDKVAPEFLKYFLQTFAAGQSLYQAVREARQRLQGLEDDYPYASWLPVICQNPATKPLYWQELLGPKPDLPVEPVWSRFRTVLLLNVAVTAAVVGVRLLGFLQPLELGAFDFLQQQRPDEGPDPRLLVVTVTESDIQARKEYPLSDKTLAQVLAKLERYQPRVIGLDIYRDLHVGSGRTNLAPHLLNPRLIAVCETSAANKIGIPPPSGMPDNRLGFSDVVVDPDGVLRRHLLYMTTDSTSPCPANYAFSLQLALHYLAVEGIQPKVVQPEGYLQIRNTVFKRLEAQTGGYQNLDAKGHQVLLNYRLPSVAEEVALSDILNERFDPNLVKDRIVLIGVTADSVKDNFSTPYTTGTWPRQKLAGVLVQAQMVSQILSAVLNDRPLLWVWPSWGEILWIWGWSVVGSAIAWNLKWRLPLRLGLIIVALGSLYGFCFFILWLQGGWIPLVPSALALAIAAGGTVVAYSACQTKRQPYS